VEWKRRGNRGDLDPKASLEELETLTRSAGAKVAGSEIQVREAADSAYLIGSGKVEEISGLVKGYEVDIVIFDHELSPTQQRNLERKLDTRVIDRTQLILDIFARRARTREGQLQVELAQLEYLLPRLAGKGTALSRLGGGIGTRGPGETKLETDRRRIRARIAQLEKATEAVRGTRGTQRRQRQSVPLQTVALVGYTNAGKSTLFNRLTGAGVIADARMFATLDPTVRTLLLPSRRKVLLSDTVGFIRSLPTTLVKAFRATLEEVVEATLLLHVVDGSSETASSAREHVNAVLEEIGAQGTRQLLVWNKMDREGAAPAPPDAIGISAATGEGIAALLERIESSLPAERATKAVFRIPASDGAAMHLLHEFGRIENKRLDEDVWQITAEVSEELAQRLEPYR
jgi:GTP-binding protein HflX